MKKIINKIFLAILFVAVFTSCKKALDVDPLQSVDAAKALETDQDVNSLVVGGYATMGGGSYCNMEGNVSVTKANSR